MSNDGRFDKLEAKFDKLDERLDSIDKTLALNTQSLETHIKRTDLLEDYVKVELRPIKKHVDFMSTAFKVVAWIAMVFVGALGVIETLKALGLISF